MCWNIKVCLEFSVFCFNQLLIKPIKGQPLCLGLYATGPGLRDSSDCPRSFSQAINQKVWIKTKFKKQELIQLKPWPMKAIGDSQDIYRGSVQLQIVNTVAYFLDNWLTTSVLQQQQKRFKIYSFCRLHAF